jgi:hypothetical protein
VTLRKMTIELCLRGRPCGLFLGGESQAAAAPRVQDEDNGDVAEPSATFSLQSSSSSFPLECNGVSTAAVDAMRRSTTAMRYPRFTNLQDGRPSKISGQRSRTLHWNLTFLMAILSALARPLSADAFMSPAALGQASERIHAISVLRVAEPTRRGVPEGTDPSMSSHNSDEVRQGVRASAAGGAAAAVVGAPTTAGALVTHAKNKDAGDLTIEDGAEIGRLVASVAHGKRRPRKRGDQDKLKRRGAADALSQQPGGGAMTGAPPARGAVRSRSGRFCSASGCKKLAVYGQSQGEGRGARVCAVHRQAADENLRAKRCQHPDGATRTRDSCCLRARPGPRSVALLNSAAPRDPRGSHAAELRLKQSSCALSYRAAP